MQKFMQKIESQVEAYDKKMGKNAGLSYMLINSVFGCILGVLIKLLIHVPLNQIMAYQTFLLGSLNCLVMNYYNLPIIPKSKKLFFLLALRGFTGHLGFLSFSYSVRNLNISEAYTLVFTSPIFTGIIGYLVLNEPYTIFELLSSLSSFIGIIFICKPPFIFSNEVINFDQDYRNAQLVALFGSFMFAWIMVIMRFLGQETNVFQVVAHFSIMNFISATLELQYHQAKYLSWFDGLILIILGISAYIQQLAMTRGCQLEKAGKASVVNYTQIVYTFIIGVILFDEKIDAYSCFGILAVLLTSVVLFYKNFIEDSEEQCIELSSSIEKNLI